MKKIIFIIIFLAILSIIGFQMVLAANVDLNCANNAYPWCKSASELGGSSGLVARFYNIGLGLVGFTAFGAIIFGAIKYTLSQGNPAKMQDALAWIWGAVWGIILLLGGWLLLNTINPEIVRLEDPGGKIYPAPVVSSGKAITESKSTEILILENFTNDQCKKRMELEKSRYEGSFASSTIVSVNSEGKGTCRILINK